MRKLLAFSILVFSLSSIFSIFWYNDWVYNLPTPVPVDYCEIKPGSYIDLQERVKIDNKKPFFIHFFNPDCPCSRFNIPHFKSLVKKYGNKISFVVVVITNNMQYSAELINERYGLNVPVLFDKTLANSCGVYSTPQAVLIDSNNILFYRGNYNKSRYCTDIKSNYAQMAIDSLLSNQRQPVFTQLALKAYGCQLPGCIK